MPLSPQKREELHIDINQKFDSRFSRIVELADRGDDVGYGKGLARLQIDIEHYFLDKFEQLLIEKQERIENLTETELTAEKGTYEIVVNKDSVINILKE